MASIDELTVRDKLAALLSLTGMREPVVAADELLAEHNTEAEHRVADWIEQHDPERELTWFIDSLREGLAKHDQDRCSLCPDEETT